MATATKYTVIKFDNRRNQICFSEEGGSCYDSLDEAILGAVDKADREIDVLTGNDAEVDGFYGIPEDEDFKAGRAVRVVLYARDGEVIISERFIIKF